MANSLVKEDVFLVDIGNSAVKWAMSSELPMSEVIRQNYDGNITHDFFCHLWLNNVKPQRVLVTCVASEQIWQTLVKACLILWEIKPKRVKARDAWHGLINSYTNPSALGSDRWCAMVAAFQSTESDFVVVDCGTALTIDVVNNAGLHLGGYILPGLATMTQSLGLHTANINIEQINADTAGLTPGHSTEQCVQAGISLATVKTIEFVVGQRFQESKECKCYLTGGDATAVSVFLALKFEIIPDLVLRGLSYLAEDN